MKRLYFKLTLLMGAAFVVSSLVIIVVFGSLNERYFRPSFAQEFQALTEELEPLLEGKSSAEAQQVIDQQQLNFRVRVVALDEASDLLGYQPAGADYRVVFEADEGKFANFQKLQGGYLIVALMMTALVFGLTAFVFTYPLARRLKKQEEAVGRIAAGDLSARVDEGGKDALGLLGERINLMAARLANLMDGQRHLLHAVSHEMRTPVARIGFGIEMVEDAPSEEERKKRIAALHDDLAEMDALLDELMMFMRVDAGSGELEVVQIETADLVNALIEKTGRLFPNAIFENKFPPRVIISASEKYLPRALENLIRNAARHAKKIVRVSCAMNEHQIVIEVHDDGSGVPVSQRGEIFDAFARLDQSRTRNTGDGAGLGLAITERIVRLHRGTISVGDSPLGGALFTVALPRA